MDGAENGRAPAHGAVCCCARIQISATTHEPRLPGTPTRGRNGPQTNCAVGTLSPGSLRRQRRGGAAGAERRLAGGRGGAWGRFSEGVAGGCQISCVHWSNGRFDSVNGKISPRRVGCSTKRTASAKVSVVFRNSPAACGRFEKVDRFCSHALAKCPYHFVFASRNEPPRARVPEISE
eukprot:gene24243-biopygen17901